MSRPYRTFARAVAYTCPLFEAALLTRTTHRSLGVSKARLAQGRVTPVAMYGVRSTPLADTLLAGIAWFPANAPLPRPWLYGESV